MATTSQMSDHVTKLRQSAREIMDLFAKLDGLYREYSYSNMGESFPANFSEIGHTGLTAEDIVGMYETITALRVVMDGGQGANVVKILP